MPKERKLLKERKEAKENFLAWEKYVLYEKNYNELRRHVKLEENKALYLLIFLSIVLFMTIDTISWYTHWIKLVVYAMSVITMWLLLYVLVWLWNKSKPHAEVFHMHITEIDFQTKYRLLYEAWIKKYTVNSVVVVVTTVLFLLILFLHFFLPLT